MKLPSGEKVSPTYWTSAGARICTLLLTATCLSHKLCCGPSFTTYTMYLPSGETAVLWSLPLAVNLAIFMLEEALVAPASTGFAWFLPANRYSPMPSAMKDMRIAPATTVKLVLWRLISLTMYSALDVRCGAPRPVVEKGGIVVRSVI